MQLPQIQKMKKYLAILFMALYCLCSNAQITNITICNGDSVLFYGRYYHSAGTYYYSKKVIDHIDTIAGYNNMIFDTVYRDSIINTLHLTIQNPVVTTKYINSCMGERVDYNGKSYTSSTTIFVQEHSASSVTAHRISASSIGSVISP